MAPSNADDACASPMLAWPRMARSLDRQAPRSYRGPARGAGDVEHRGGPPAVRKRDGSDVAEAGSSEISVGCMDPPSQGQAPSWAPHGTDEYIDPAVSPVTFLIQYIPVPFCNMFSAMSHQSTVSASSGCEPYQISDYDRAIQQAAKRERAEQAARSQSNTPTAASNGSTGYAPPSQALRLPGLNDLFASKLLINPNMAEGRKTPTYNNNNNNNNNNLRRDSVAGYSYFDPVARPGYSGRSDARAPPPLIIAPPQYRSSSQTSPISIQNLCSPSDVSVPSRTPSLSTSPTASQSSASSLRQPMAHVTATSPYELPPAFFGSSDLAPATYVYQAASSYEGVSYIPGRGPCHMYAGGYSIPTHVFQDPLNLTQSKILRKRLSVACSTCRKKKIKCEPGPDGCLQCKKAQRPCKIEPAKRRLKSAAAGSFHAEKSPV